MKQHKKIQMSEAFQLGAVLAVVGGFLDAYSYLFRGGGFANAQTGNIVLLGISLQKGKWQGAVHYAIPILAFAAGVIVVELIKKYFKQHPKIHWRQIIVMIEAAMICLVAFIPSGEADMIANVIISFVCAMQVETFRKVHGNVYATTMCTGNLRSGMEILFKYFQTKDRELLNRSLKYFGIILFFIVGAAAGTAAGNVLSHNAVLICSALLLAVFFMMFMETKKIN